MKKLLLLLFLPLWVNGQVTFNHFYDFDPSFGPVVFRSIIKTADGGYAAIGSLYYTPWSDFDQQGNEILNYTNDIILLKTDSAFHVQWSKIYYSVIDFTYEEGGVKLKEKPGGGFVLLTETNDPFNIYYTGRPANLISTDSWGNVLWSKSFSATTGYDKPFDFIIDSDNSIVVVGSTNFLNAGRRMWVYKTDQYGSLLWGNTYTTSQGELHSILRAPSGGYVVTGKRSTDVVIMRLTTNGTNIWTRTYATAASEGGQTIIQNGSGYAVLVNTTAGNSQLILTDSGGVVSSAKNYASFTGNTILKNNSSFIITGVQGNAALSFTTDLSGNVTGSARKYSITGFVMSANEAIVDGNMEYICGSADVNGWINKTDLGTGYSGGCYKSGASMSATGITFTVATINPAITDLFMEPDVEALMVDELIYINQYIMCSCSPPVVEITSAKTTICPSDTIAISATVNSTFSYQWYKNSSLISGAVSSQYNATVQGSYFTVVNGTCGTDTSNIITLSPLPGPVINSVSADSALSGETLTISGTGFLNVSQVELDLNASFVVQNDQQIQFEVPDDAASAPVRVTAVNGCKASSDTVFVTDECKMGLSVFVEGLYLGGLQTLTDTLTIEFHQPQAPYAIVASYRMPMDAGGQVSLMLPYYFFKKQFYISVHTQNALETWSRNPVYVSRNVNFTFTGQ